MAVQAVGLLTTALDRRGRRDDEPHAAGSAGKPHVIDRDDVGRIRDGQEERAVGFPVQGKDVVMLGERHGDLETASGSPTSRWDTNS